MISVKPDGERRDITGNVSEGLGALGSLNSECQDRKPINCAAGPSTEQNGTSTKLHISDLDLMDSHRQRKLIF